MNNFEMLKVAEKYLGQGGSRFRKYCGLPSGSAWCNAFVDYIFNEAGNANLFCGGKKITYCPTSIKWCQQNLAQIPIYLALPCDVIYFDWEPNGVPNHIGFVRGRKSDQEVYTIEGNTSGGIVAKKTRTAKYVCGCYRPHFKGEWKDAHLEVDGYCGYNTIAMLQKALGIKVDGILGKGTVKALQKKVGVSQDGSWGVKTSKAVQKMLKKDGFYKGKIDGLVYKETVKALQKWINAQNKQNKKVSATQERIDKGLKWAEEQTKKGYVYVNWDGSAKAKECPICKKHSKGKYYGWNCIGFVSAVLHHGLGLKTKCANNGLLGGNDSYTYLLTHSLKEAQAYVDKKLGKGLFEVIKTGKTLTTSDLKEGDIVIYYKGKEFWHIAVYVGKGMIIDCSSSTNGVTRRSYKLAYPVKAAVRYIGK